MDIMSKKESRSAIQKHNILRHWCSLKEVMKSGYTGKVNIRDTRPSSSCFRYGIAIKDLASEVLKLKVSPSLLYFNETAPDSEILIQGELMQSYEYLELTYSFEKVSNRKALENPSFARGLQAQMLLEKYLDKASLEDINEILYLYPDHVVEFSTFAIKLGSLMRNTIIWEIRKY
jgi:hypothetical protein